jgi:hypothetical protein
MSLFFRSMDRKVRNREIEPMKTGSSESPKKYVLVPLGFSGVGICSTDV